MRYVRLPSLVACLALAALPVHADLDLGGDGMSDVWQIRFGALDADPAADDDGDGYSNLAESQAGTDPFDANSNVGLDIHSFTLGADEIMVSWQRQFGKSYVVEASADPSGNWAAVGPVLTGGGLVFHTIDATGVPELLADLAFYRIAVSDVDADRDPSLGEVSPGSTAAPLGFMG